MDYSAHYQQQQAYDPASVQQYYDQSYYTYPDPQYANYQPYPYQNLPVQTTQHEQQEPNPPGVAAVLPPQQVQDPYYQYQVQDPAAAAAAVQSVGPQQGGVDAGVPVVHQPIVQPSYGGYGVAPQGPPQTHIAPKPEFPTRPFRGRGSGRGRGRGRGRGMNKRPGGPHIQGGPGSNFGPIPMPYQGPAHSVPAPPPPSKAQFCELCRVDCNTLEILEQHINGKKHQKKLKMFEGLQKLNKPSMVPTPTPAPEVKPEVPPQQLLPEAPPQQLLPEVPPQQPLPESTLPSEATTEEIKAAEETQKAEAVKPTEESQGMGRGLKRKNKGGSSGRKAKPTRIVEPPKPKEVMVPLVCELCNVKCESAVVFQSHLVGKKHLAKAKLFLSQHEVLGQVVLQALGPALQALQQQQNVNASTSYASQLHFPGFGTSMLENNPNMDNMNFGGPIVVNGGENTETALDGAASVPEQSLVVAASASASALGAVPGQDAVMGQDMSAGTEQQAQ